MKLKEHLECVYSYDYLMELLQRYVYSYLMDDWFEDCDKNRNTLQDFLYAKIKENEKSESN